MANKRATDILNFWFGTDFVKGLPAVPRDKLWFMADAALDRTITETFGEDVLKASQGTYQSWEHCAEDRMALIILLDQFTRNIYRKTAQAFAYDSEARRLCRAGIERGHDQALMPVYRVFFYLPLEHSESLEDQEYCVTLCQALLENEPLIAEPLAGYVRYAELHRDIIKRFGRFPHRNKLLGRASTPEEEEYLRSGGTNFGQG